MKLVLFSFLLSLTGVSSFAQSDLDSLGLQKVKGTSCRARHGRAQPSLASVRGPARDRLVVPGKGVKAGEGLGEVPAGSTPGKQ